MSGGSRLLDDVRNVIRIKHYSIRTEQAYLQWIRRYILFHGKRHPRELGAEHLSAFLSDLAVRGRVAASTQNQALNAILFLYREVLKQTLPWIEGVQRAKQPQHLPVVLTHAEVKHVLVNLEGTVWLMASLTYGVGLRLLECLRLRVKDIDFERAELTIRDGKGQKDRVTMLPRKLIDPLRTHLSRVHLLHERHEDPSIHARVSSADITSVPTYSSGQSRTLCAAPASSSPPAFTRYGIPIAAVAACSVRWTRREPQIWRMVGTSDLHRPGARAVPERNATAAVIGAGAQLLSRYERGDAPVLRVKNREKYAGSANPQVSAISATLMFV
jgi:hypothetical protein